MISDKLLEDFAKSLSEQGFNNEEFQKLFIDQVGEVVEDLRRKIKEKEKIEKRKNPHLFPFLCEFSDVVVTYKTIEVLLEEGDYIREREEDCIPKEIYQDFPTYNNETPVKLKATLVSFPYDLTYEQLLEGICRLDLRSANIQELLCFCSAYPKEVTPFHHIIICTREIVKIASRGLKKEYLAVPGVCRQLTEPDRSKGKKILLRAWIEKEWKYTANKISVLCFPI